MNAIVTPKVYVGTWHKYNNGSIKGCWMDLLSFDSESKYYAECLDFHKDEAAPELMNQDYEGIPRNMISECHIDWSYIEAFSKAVKENCEEAYYHWVSETGETDFDRFRDAWWGAADSEEDFAVKYANETGLLNDVPQRVALYFDYKAYARDLFLGDFIFTGGHVFRL